MADPMTVVKLGGAVCRDQAQRSMSLSAIERLAQSRPVLVLPGGGIFADAVRDAQKRLKFSDSAAHWMAILAMDQMAHLIADLMSNTVLIDDPAAATAAHARHLVPVLAPYQWVRAQDQLPHSWDVTSDSIAAFIARQIGAGTLILVKATEGSWEELVDPAFAALRGTLTVRACTPAQLRTLAAA